MSSTSTVKTEQRYDMQRALTKHVGCRSTRGDKTYLRGDPPCTERYNMRDPIVAQELWVLCPAGKTMRGRERVAS
jgi:hypothetical protein